MDKDTLILLGKGLLAAVVGGAGTALVDQLATGKIDWKAIAAAAVAAGLAYFKLPHGAEKIVPPVEVKKAW